MFVTKSRRMDRALKLSIADLSGRLSRNLQESKKPLACARGSEDTH
jgi:hypothetical protein